MRESSRRRMIFKLYKPRPEPRPSRTKMNRFINTLLVMLMSIHQQSCYAVEVPPDVIGNPEHLYHWMVGFVNDESTNVKMEDLEDVDFDMKDDTNMTPLHVAALFSNAKLAKFLIGLKKENNEHRVDINAQDDHQFTPLMYAITTRNTTIIKLLLENNADVHNLENENGDTAHDMVEKMDDTPA